MSIVISVLAAGVGTFGFGILYHIRGKKLLLATLAGILGWAAYHAAGAFGLSESLRYLVAAAAVTGYSEIFARVEKTPTTTFLAPGVIPLVPGGGLYYSMNYAMKEEWPLFAETALNTLELAAFIAIGIIVVTSVSRIFSAVWIKVRKT